jgi:branched-chain amino acid transport system substrate-binding protein
VRRRLFVLGIVAVAGAALLVIAGTGSSAPKGAQVLPSAACGPVFYKGAGRPQYLIASDLPLQGAGRAQNIAMGKAIQFILDRQYHFKAGKYTIGYQACDDSTAQAAKWDAAKCTSNG